MNTMDTEELSTHLHEATTDLTPRPGFTAAVTRGGRRRQVRYRIGVATAMTAAIALVGGSTYALLTSSEVTANQIMAGWLAGSTKGDLADDQGFLNQALAAWEAGKSRSPNASAGVFDDLRDTPHVYWAGNTPAGRAAVVVQQAYLHPHEQLPPEAADTLQTLVGLVAIDPKDGKLKLVGDQFQARPSDPLPGVFFFGEDDHVLLVVDRQQLVWECHIALGTLPGQELTEEQLRSQWNQVPMIGGVGITRFDYDRPEFLVSGPDPLLKSRVNLRYQLASDYVGAARVGGTGPLQPPGIPLLGWDATWTVGRASGFEFNLDEMRTKDLWGPGSAGPNFVGNSTDMRLRMDTWTISAGLDDGRVAVVTAIKRNDDPWRTAVVLVNPDLTVTRIEGPVINRHVPLPIAVRLPDGQGWIVAAKDQPLSYRTNGDWRSAGTNAALLPDDATQVKVGDTVVDLPR
jgi:predicted ribosomally synthesized peptide with SipW-like signal peptide